MAVAAGIGLGELALLAAAAIAAIWTASPQGQKATREAVKEVSDGLSRESDTTDVAPTTDCNKKECDPCPWNFCQDNYPPPPPPRVDRVPPSTPHFPCPGDHVHTYWYQLNQNPETCQCFCNMQEDVKCL
jgi:hypothetical protein